MTSPCVDLRSDTVTRPTAAMRAAMMDAPVGDDVLGDDPTVKRLEAISAERAGTEAALFMPSGTMANQVAIRGHTRPGDRILLEANSHPYLYEAGGPAVISGVLVSPIAGEDGILSESAVTKAVPPEDDHFAPATLLCIENTTNRGGGRPYPLETLRGLHAVARELGLKTHLDGARIFNAAICQGQSVTTLCDGFDSVSFCLSKGLGAPVGSLLCGPRDWIRTARRTRKMLGGGMRQSGILAAAGLYALEHNVDRLADDHARARLLWEGLRRQGWETEEPTTNMLYLSVPDASTLSCKLAGRGVLCIALAHNRIRLVTHLDITDEGVEQAIESFKGLAPQA
jgi:threonine aldolase